MRALIMKLRQQIAFVCLVLVFLAYTLSFQAAGQKPQAYYVKPDQTADLLSETKLVTAKQNCENWAIAAGLETMLQQQKVPLDQNFWVMRLAGGELCLADLPTIDAVAHTVNNEFVLDDGRHVRLEAHFVPGPPVNVDAVIAGLKLQQLSLLIWRAHPYFLTGITYDEHIATNGTHFFVLKELRLTNTFGKLPGVTFEKGRDNPDDIQGILSVTVTAL
jgi:hypothetical protein